MKTTLIFLLLTVTTSFASALPERELRRELTKSQQACSNLDCDGVSIRAQEHVFEELPTPVQTGLLEIADHFVQVWGDTILEGDYIADDKFNLDEVEILSHHGEHVGYRITYSADAWDTSTCPYDSENPESVEQCIQGRIVEKGVITLDGQGYFVDPGNYAEFVD